MSDWSSDEGAKALKAKNSKKSRAAVDSWSEDEPVKPRKKPVKKHDSDWSDDEPKKVVKKQPKSPPVTKKKPVHKDEDWSDNEKPVKKPTKSTKKRDDDWSSEEEKPKPKKVVSKKKQESDWSEDEKPKKVKAKSKKVDDWSEGEKPRKFRSPPKEVEKDSDWSEDEEVPAPKKSSKPQPKKDKWSDDEKVVKPKKSKPKPESDWSEDEKPKKKSTKSKPKSESDWSEDEKPAPKKAQPKQKVPPSVTKSISDWSEPESIPAPKKSKPKPKPESEWSEEEAAAPPSKPVKKSPKKPVEKKKENWSSDEDEQPVKKAPVKKPEPVKPKVKAGWSSDEEAPAKKAPPATKPKKVQQKDSDDEGWGSEKEKGSDDAKSLMGSDAGSDASERAPVTYVPDYDAEEDEDLYKQTCSVGIDFKKYDSIEVQCSGYDKKNSDRRAKTWGEIELNEILEEKITKQMRWKRPTPIQMRAIPILHEGRDIMGCAQTGSGKTGAFSIPIVNSLLEDGASDGSDSDASDAGSDDGGKTCCQPKALVCAPTRELVQQIQRDFIKLCKDTSIKCEYVVGGHAVRNQLEKIEGSHIVIATPGRLNDFVGKGKIKLDKLKYLVIDEADRMLDMGFQTILEQLAYKMPDKEERITTMFSATFPDEVQKIGHKFLKENYVFIAIGIVGGAANTVKQAFVEIDGDVNKEDKLIDLLNEVKDSGEKTVIFVETKRLADYLATKLCTLDFPATSIHGDRAQEERELALRNFRNGTHPVLVATNVAAQDRKSVV